MRHAKHRYSLNRIPSIRKALLVSTAKNLLTYQRIRTTLVRAKATRQLVEKLISMGKRNTVADRRRAFSLLGDHKIVSLLFDDIAPRFKEHAGGSTRILHLGRRRGDDASMVLFELTAVKEPPRKTKPEKEKEAKPVSEPRPEKVQEKAVEEPGKEIPPAPKEKEKKPHERRSPESQRQAAKKPPKTFFSGIRNIFKKERDSL
ncbi:MAG: 50S ribosomal protein L17 [Candidatus Omnitrophica bacterium]|nr:50S ribosomal protein L17 [Candidatus Omnitrophota bacterium]